MLRWKFIWMLILFLPGALMLTSVACSPDAPTAPATTTADAPGAVAMVTPPVGPQNIYGLAGGTILASDGAIYRAMYLEDVGCHIAGTYGGCPWEFQYLFHAPVSAASVRLFSQSSTSSTWWMVDDTGSMWRRGLHEPEWVYLGTPQFTPNVGTARPPVTAHTGGG
jgi:hypothetical protein